MFLKEIKIAFPDVIINGSYRSRLPSNLNISILGVDSEILISKLKNAVISSGSACSSKDLELSPVLLGMGLKEDIIRSAMRIGIGRFNTEKDVILAVEEIVKAAKIVRNVNCNI